MSNPRLRNPQLPSHTGAKPTKPLAPKLGQIFKGDCSCGKPALEGLELCEECANRFCARVGGDRAKSVPCLHCEGSGVLPVLDFNDKDEPILKGEKECYACDGHGVILPSGLKSPTTDPTL